MNTKKIVLIPEEENDSSECYATALSKKGFEVVPAPKDGTALLHLIYDKKPVAVLMEVFMPGLDALGVTPWG